MAVDSARAADAFVRFFRTYKLLKPVQNLSDLADGIALHELLSLVDNSYFRQAALPPSDTATNEWIDRLTSLKRVYRLMMQYFNDVLQQSTAKLEVPDLSAIAKEQSTHDILALCKLAVALAVQSEKKKDVIERIQKLSDDDQHHLMKAIEEVMTKMNPQNGTRVRTNSMTDDDHYYQIQAERNKALMEKESLQKSYEALMVQHQILQTTMEDVKAEKSDVISRLKQAEKDADDRRQDRSEMSLRGEIDRLRVELQRAEDSLGNSEAEVERQTSAVHELQRQVEELQPKADEAIKIKDQLDEYRHAADKFQKTENVMEKYKKKLEEGALLRRRIKSLEDQNASLVDRNASLEEDYRKVASYKPLMESYRMQITELETKGSTRDKEAESVKFELSQAKTRLRIVTEEREKDAEHLELYQERVRELELTAPRTTKGQRKSVDGNMTEMTEAELMGGHVQDLGDELEDALTGTTTTDLKLQIRQLKRDLEAAQSNTTDSTRLVVLENLLADANRMKARYEQDYLSSHRDSLKLQSELDDIRSGKAYGDGPEAAIALRHRLNETVESLEAIQKEHNDLSVKFDSQAKELIVAKSDLNLVNRDQLDILSSLRESVNQDKEDLMSDMKRAKERIKELSEKNRMQLEQINTLLIEKVNMQSDGIGQREKMLEKERNYSDLRASLAGKDLPPDIKQRLLSMHEENVQLKEQSRSTQEKLAKAKAFIKNQDQLYKAEAATKSMRASPDATDSESRRVLDEQVEQLKEENANLRKWADRDKQLLLNLVHDMGMKRMKDHLRGQQHTVQKQSWLGRERHMLGQSVTRLSRQ